MKCVDTTRISVFDATDVEVSVWGFSRSLECLLHDSWWSCWSSKSEGDIVKALSHVLAHVKQRRCVATCCTAGCDYWTGPSTVYQRDSCFAPWAASDIRCCFVKESKWVIPSNPTLFFFEASEHSVDVFKEHTLTVNTSYSSYFNMFRILITFRF